MKTKEELKKEIKVAAAASKSLKNQIKDWVWMTDRPADWEAHFKHLSTMRRNASTHVVALSTALSYVSGESAHVALSIRGGRVDAHFYAYALVKVLGIKSQEIKEWTLRTASEEDLRRIRSAEIIKRRSPGYRLKNWVWYLQMAANADIARIHIALREFRGSLTSLRFNVRLTQISESAAIIAVNAIYGRTSLKAFYVITSWEDSVVTWKVSVCDELRISHFLSDKEQQDAMTLAVRETLRDHSLVTLAWKDANENLSVE